MDPNNILSLLFPFLVIVGIVAAIGATVYFVANMRRGDSVQLPLRGLFRAYLYLLSLVSLLVFVAGLSSLGRAGFASIFGNEFSYQPVYLEGPLYRPALPVGRGEISTDPSPEYLAEQQRLAEKQRVDGLSQAYRNGLIEGLTFTIIGAFLWGAHIIGRRKLETRDEQESGVLNRVYMIVLLLIFSIMTVMSLPAAVRDTLAYNLLDHPSRSSSEPGGLLATAIVVLPFWLLYLGGTIRLVVRQK